MRSRRSPPRWAPTCPARSAAGACWRRGGGGGPSRVRGGRGRGAGAGERLEPAAPGAPYGVLVLPVDAALPTPAVFAEADRGTLRTAAELEEARARLRTRDVLAGGVANDL